MFFPCFSRELNLLAYFSKDEFSLVGWASIMKVYLLYKRSFAYMFPCFYNNNNISGIFSYFIFSYLRQTHVIFRFAFCFFCSNFGRGKKKSKTEEEIEFSRLISTLPFKPYPRTLIHINHLTLYPTTLHSNYRAIDNILSK